MRFSNPEELNARNELFFDPERPFSENQGPYLIVMDDFYAEPKRIREMALEQEFYQYSPPQENQVEAEIVNRFTHSHPHWFSTSLLRYHGTLVKNPQPGFRYAGSKLRHELTQLVKEDIDTNTWNSLGDGWNGAFHLQYAGSIPVDWSIHHHYKENDVYPRGWSGLVYLNPDAPKSSGTSIWLNKRSEKCIAQKGAVFTQDTGQFENVFTIQNKFNRLVLFRENVLHRAEQAFGDSPESGRLTQTFFFLSRGMDQT